jgi:transaldolase
MADNPLQELQAFGQSVWLDFISRGLVASGQLKRFIDEDGLRGVTSNPAIFDKAIGGSADYDADICAMCREGRGAEAVCEALMVEDVRRAADVFRPVFEATAGRDGFVSLEVSPQLAYETERTAAEARRLWAELDRPNVFIKIPATLEGLAAIRRCIAEGINVNVTLLFGLPRYYQVAEAYVGGLEDRARRGEDVGHVASVASFFLSRIDVLADPMLEKIAHEGGAGAETAAPLVGQIAVASAKVASVIYKGVFAGDRFRKLVGRGARSQRLLWASTSTKNPAYSDVKYVEPLIGLDTVNTMPLETLEAYRDHGRPSPSLAAGAEEAAAALERLSRVGINIETVTEQLEREGVEKFVKPYEALLATLRKKCATLAPGDVGAKR